MPPFTAFTLMIVVPDERALTTPLLETVATDELDEVQVTFLAAVVSLVGVSLYLNVLDAPTRMVYL